MLTKSFLMLTIAAHGLQINPYAAHGTEKVGQHWVTKDNTNYSSRHATNFTERMNVRES